MFETLCISYTWISISSFRFLKFQHNFLKYISILLSSPSEANIMQKWGYNVLRDICFLNCFFVFLSGVLTGWFPLFYLPRLLMCSSVSVSLLFIPFNVFFFLISAIELFLTGSLYFLVPSEEAHILDQFLFLIQLTFSLPIFPIIYLINCLFLFHYLFFQGFSLAFFN